VCYVITVIVVFILDCVVTDVVVCALHYGVCVVIVDVVYRVYTVGDVLLYYRYCSCYLCCLWHFLSLIVPYFSLVRYCRYFSMCVSFFCIFTRVASVVIAHIFVVLIVIIVSVAGFDAVVVVVVSVVVVAVAVCTIY